VPNLGLLAPYRTAPESAMATKPAATQRLAREGILNYFRCISAADDNLGKLLKALQELGIAEDTIVVFTSDNGFYNGEHGLGDKRTAYDESLRIPMLVRYPKLVPKGKTRDEMVLNIDIAPTFLDLAGVTVPKQMQGKSWRPLFTDKPAGWRKAFLAEYFYERGFEGIPTVIAVRTDTAKLINYPGHEEWTELFDLVKDPYETKNLVADPAQKDLLDQMRTEFERQEKAVEFTIPDYADKPPAPGEEPKKKAGKKKATAAD